MLYTIFAHHAVAVAVGAVAVPRGEHLAGVQLLGCLGCCIGRLPLFALALRPMLGVDALWWRFPVGSVMTVTLAGLFYAYGPWRRAPAMRMATAG